MPEIRMPALGADMTSGRLIEWHVAPGAPVHRGDIVATVDTDKAEIDIETFADGVLDTLVVAPGANKFQIKAAVEEAFGVKVARVNTLNRPGHEKRMGRNTGMTNDTKRAIVKLTAESRGIEFFEGMAQQEE